MLALALTLSLATAAPPSRASEDLQERYPATMEWSRTGLGTACRPEDVWELKSFELELGDLHVEAKQAQLALGVHGTNALWAVVFPEQPAELVSPAAEDEEHTSAIFLRFAPSELGRLFPERTVRGPGEPWRRAEAWRIFRHKLGHKWYTPSGNTTVVPRGIVIVDADTLEGPRRAFELSRDAGSVQVLDEFTAKPVPASPPLDADAAEAVLDAVWEAFDAEYAKFVDLPDVDWDRLRKRYRPLAREAGTVYGTAAVVADLLAHLEDLHAWVRSGDDWVPGYDRERPLNASWAGTQALVGALREDGPNLHWGRTDDGLGYLNVHGLGDEQLPQRFDAALEELGDTWGLVVDLRFNGGGNELLGRDLAGRFAREPHVYSTNQYRDGEEHDDLGPVLERGFEPRGPWRYAAPVVVLQGPRTLSSAESTLLMFAQCAGVTTLGAHTGGSSGNPRRLEPGHGLVVNLPRWRDMTPDGTPLEGVGVAPDVELAFEAAAFTDQSDPLAAAALQRLRATPEDERAPGRRE